MKASEAIVTGQRRCLGYMQISAAMLASAVEVADQNLDITGAPLAPGTNIGYMIIQQNVAGASVRWRDDTGVPTAAKGMVLTVGELDFVGDFWELQAIAASGSPILDITIYE